MFRNRQKPGDKEFEIVLIDASTESAALPKAAQLAKKHGARVMIWGGGVGPLFGDNAADLAADVIECCDAAGIRDERSMRGAKALGIDTAHLYLSADAALLTPPRAPGKENIAKFPKAPDKRCGSVPEPARLPR
jgi:polysaccharide pyruvyl transferase WcaK-like protein